MGLDLGDCHGRCTAPTIAASAFAATAAPGACEEGSADVNVASAGPAQLTLRGQAGSVFTTATGSTAEQITIDLNPKVERAFSREASEPSSAPAEDPAAAVGPSVTLSTTSCSDAPSTEDRLGFEPYVRAVAWFLIDPKTEPPLTLSVEGPWGSGKSSFMLQLARRLRKLADERKDVGKVRAVWFNPWKNDKDESLWASFALTLLKQLERDTPFPLRLVAKAKLTFWRIQWGQLAPSLSLMAVFALATLLLWAAPSILSSIVTRFPWQTIKVVTAALPWVTTAVAVAGAGRAVGHVLGNPLPKSLAKYIRNPRFDERISLIERFGREFADILRAYVGNKGRVYAFIDDLDRCEVPRAAELMQAINLLMSSDLQLDLKAKPKTTKPPSLIFILGIDREMVAAGIAAKNATVLPYLASRQPPPETLTPSSGDLPPSAAIAAATDTYRYGIDYGYAFLEKFIQTPFHLPRVRAGQLKAWIQDIVSPGAALSAAAAPAAPSPVPTAAPERGELLAGQDPDRFEDIVNDVAGAFQFSPRQVKQFVNLLRLQIAIAIQTGQLVEAPSTASGGVAYGLTLERLAMISAIFLEKPSFVGRIFEDPMCLDQIERGGGATGIGAIFGRLGPRYSLVGIPLESLVEVLPDAYPGSNLGAGRGHRTRLTSGKDVEFTANNSPSPDGPSPT